MRRQLVILALLSIIQLSALCLSPPFVYSMNFRRNRKNSWRVPNLYLRDSWGQSYGLARPQRFDLKRFFLYAMILFGIADVLLVLVFLFVSLFPARPASPVARRVTRTPAVTAVAQHTATAAPEPTEQATGEPAATRVRRRTRTPAPTAVPTQAPEPTLPVVVEKNVAPARTIAYELPASLQTGGLEISVPPEPVDCTPADQMPAIVSESVKLCAGQEYRPFTVRGENIGVFGDKSAPIRANGRGYGITVEGARIFITNVLVRATTDAGDAAILLSGGRWWDQPCGPVRR